MQPAIEPSELRAERARTKPADAAKWAQWNRPVEIRVLAAMFADPGKRHVGGPFEDVEPSMFHNADTRTAITLVRNLDAAGTPATLDAIADRWKLENRDHFYARGEQLIAEIKECEPERTLRGQAALAAELEALKHDALNRIADADRLAQAERQREQYDRITDELVADALDYEDRLRGPRDVPPPSDLDAPRATASPRSATPSASPARAVTCSASCTVRARGACTTASAGRRPSAARKSPRPRPR
jgi:hypothetical protein